jgi:hypothetical protein
MYINDPHGMCQFGTIQQGSILEHPPVKCMCGEYGNVGIQISNTEMILKKMAYTTFGTISGSETQVQCQTTGEEDTCYHFDLNSPCDKCENGWSGKNCQFSCDKCFLDGTCNNNPSLSVSTYLVQIVYHAIKRRNQMQIRVH